MAFVLLLNDHILKRFFAGSLSGKMSDVVGPFVLYRLLRGFSGLGLCPKAAFIITAGFSVAIKSSQDLSDLVTQFTCGIFFSRCRLVADRMDILAFAPFFAFGAGALLINQFKETLCARPGRPFQSGCGSQGTRP